MSNYRVNPDNENISIQILMQRIDNGINKLYTKSLVYADNYMKEKAEYGKDSPTKADENFKFIKERFMKFNKLILRIQKYVEYPFSKELYGVSSRNYKFQISLATILAGVFHKLEQENKTEYVVNNETSLEKFLEVLEDALKNAFIEDPNYNASSTNSEKLSELVEGISFEKAM
ncbi:MAG: hypothetical protein MJB12_18145 [Firmicutes bacterium]|nr:hypothetical protein [Bacillota bacterium]